MKELRTAILLLLALTVICGGVYPAMVTVMAQAVFHYQASGSLITAPNGRVRGSRLIGQPFSDARYFWPRPSATGEFPYNPLASGGSNAGPTNPAYLKSVSERVTALRTSGLTGAIPAELVQASASGLDPHISPAAALLQVPRVARARGLAEAQVQAAVTRATEGRQFGFLGEPRVNVLALNLVLDKLAP